MARIAYISRKFQQGSIDIIELANAICADMRSQGYDLTLRQLYYQFIRRDYFPNSEKSYDRLGSIINDARLAGLLDWGYLTDRTRHASTPYINEDVTDLFTGIEDQLAYDRWRDQDVHIEVWVEKQALEQVVARAAQARQVSYLACKGYMSQSEQHTAAMRMLDKIEAGKRVVVLHLGDHDPSGIDMTRDNTDRLSMFLGHHIAEAWGHDDDDEPMDLFDMSEAAARLYGTPTEQPDGPYVLDFQRIALNMDQVRQYQPPPNPAKMSDSRAGGYVTKFGRSSWELDALTPQQMNTLITDAIDAVIDPDAWRAAGQREADAQGKVRDWIADNLQSLVDAGLATDD